MLPEDLPLQGSYLYLAVKDRAVMGEGILLGEAYLPLQDLFVQDLGVSIEVMLSVYANG